MDAAARTFSRSQGPISRIVSAVLVLLPTATSSTSMKSSLPSEHVNASSRPVREPFKSAPFAVTVMAQLYHEFMSHAILWQK